MALKQKPSVIMFSYFSLIALADIFILIPMTKYFELGNTSALYKAIFKDMRSFLVPVLALSITIFMHSLYVLSLKDVFLGIKRVSNAKTPDCMTRIGLATAAILFLGVGFMVFAVEGSFSTALNCAVVVLAGFCAVYMSSFWILCLIVAVLEELMDVESLHGFVFVVVMILAFAALSKAFSYSFSDNFGAATPT